MVAEPEAGIPPSTEYVAPLSPPIVVGAFDPPEQPWLPGHRGVDLATGPGTAVRAAGDGTVAHAGTVVDRGVVSITHPDGVRTTYEPVRATVSEGDRVRAGDVIGTVEGLHDGCRAVACLHWGVRLGDDYLDPMSLLGMSGGEIRLKPLVEGD